MEIKLGQIPDKPFWSISKIMIIAAGDHQDSPGTVTPGVSAIAAKKLSKGIRVHNDQ